jgi:hypothetical protein
VANGDTAKYRATLLVLGNLFAIWGILGLIDLRNRPYYGYRDDGNNTVTRVYPGSPAESAGLQRGDYVRSYAGIPIEDTGALMRLGRAKIGETRSLIVERPGAAGEAALAKTVDIAVGSLPGREVALGYAAALIGLCFLGFGVGGYLKVTRRSGLLLALIGLCLGMAFFGGPYLSSFTARTLVGTIQESLVFLSFAFLLHYVLEFPKQKPLLQKKHALAVLYAPAVLLVLFDLFWVIVQPRATSALNRVTNILFELFLAAYLVCAVVAIIHTYAEASGEERSAHGLNIMLAGTLIGFLPVIIVMLMSAVAPRVLLPGRFLLPDTDPDSDHVDHGSAAAEPGGVTSAKHGRDLRALRRPYFSSSPSRATICGSSAPCRLCG